MSSLIPPQFPVLPPFAPARPHPAYGFRSCSPPPPSIYQCLRVALITLKPTDLFLPLRSPSTFLPFPLLSSLFAPGPLTDSCFTVSATPPNCLQCPVSGPWAQLFVLQTSAPLNTGAHWFRTLLTLCFGHVLLWCI